MRSSTCCRTRASTAFTSAAPIRSRPVRRSTVGRIRSRRPSPCERDRWCALALGSCRLVGVEVVESASTSDQRDHLLGSFRTRVRPDHRTDGDGISTCAWLGDDVHKRRRRCARRAHRAEQLAGAHDARTAFSTHGTATRTRPKSLALPRKARPSARDERPALICVTRVVLRSASESPAIDATIDSEHLQTCPPRPSH